MKRYCQAVVLAIALMLLWAGSGLTASQKPASAAELALYAGADRQQILEEGAKKEGTLTFYTSGILTQAIRPLVDEFQKQYPYLKVEIYRADTNVLMSRVTQEFSAGRHVFDAIESTQTSHLVLQKAGIVQPFFSPNLAFIEEGAIKKGPAGGVLAVAFRASGVGLGYNTKLISKEELPKSYQDLLNPKWKGKMPIDGDITAIDWMGVMLDTYGEDFVKKIAAQNFTVHTVSPRGLLDMLISGEYALSPNIFDSHVITVQQQGAPIDWIPLEPVHVNMGQIALAKNAAHPYSALLFIDFELSKKSAEIHRSKGYNPFRTDVPPLAKPYKKYYGVKSLDEVKIRHDMFNKLFLKK